MTKDLIEKYFRGACTAQESASVRDFLLRHPDDDFLLHDWAEADGITPLPRNISGKMLAKISQATTSRADSSFPGSRGWIAAAAVGGIVIVAALFRVQHDAEPLLKAPGSPQPASISATWTADSNTAKARKEILLPDSSQVVLYPSSSIRYTSLFGTGPLREIFMHGQVSFKVRKNRNRPFLVRSGAVSTTATGTAFMVAASDDDKRLAVQVYDGKVHVETDSSDRKKQSFILLPGQELLYTGPGRPVIIHAIPAGKMDAAPCKGTGLKPLHE